MKRPSLVENLRFKEVEGFPMFEDIEHGELFALRLTNNTTSFTHGLHRFPAKFIPQVPGWALDQFGGEGSTVLDPFAGSGTTLVEGLLRGYRGIGVDLDPLAILISRAKTNLADPDELERAARYIKRGFSPARKLRVPMDGVENFPHWFSLDAWSKLQALLLRIERVDVGDDERRFLLVVFSSIVRWVSNADDQSQKTYVSGTLKKNPPEVLTTFWRAFDRAVAGLRDLHEKRVGPVPDVFEMDGRDLTTLGRSVDLVATSPPYFDSVDYMYNLMLEYFWLGKLVGVPTRSDFNDMRRRYLGTKVPQNAALDVPSSLGDLIRMEEMAPTRRASAAVYLQGMADHFNQASSVMGDGARYVLVVGNSQTMSRIIPTHEALRRLASDAGLQLERAFGYRVRRHYMKFPRNGRGGIILIDWVLVLKKQTAAGSPADLPLAWATLRPGDVAN